jgi:DNA-binding CsgD family transcriptional regulator
MVRKLVMSELLTKKLREIEKFSPYVDEIISPLKQLNVVGFFYVRAYDNGELLELTSNPKFAEFYFTKFFQGDYSEVDIGEHLFIEQGVSLWELNSHNLIYQDGKKYFSYGNGITICENNINFKELYSFYSMSDEIEMNRFFLNQLPNLKKFKNFFLEKASPIIDKVDKYLPPEQYQQKPMTTEKKDIATIFESLRGKTDKKAPLSHRELQCLSLLSLGNSIKEIASKLDLSPRTIEHYITNIKIKWNVRKISELIYMIKEHEFSQII